MHIVDEGPPIFSLVLYKRPQFEDWHSYLPTARFNLLMSRVSSGYLIWVAAICQHILFAPPPKFVN
jgi:hypothetical protein